MLIDISGAHNSNSSSVMSEKGVTTIHIKIHLGPFATKLSLAQVVTGPV